ncbi:Fe-Mn family superoxide dismutase [Sphaerosporella brunnea]|uniref:Superoxide dismutase n=1 Tax=Sphaerosporella brunnea TaxID=1250544 RepID=A0A5J5F2D2_9PEZI|nr:Fe-Mn family superoxide dismutase [Sphaerosporella brunnea]
MPFITRVVRPTARVVSVRGLANSAVRQKHTLPELKYGYAELEPFISGRIMELHYTKHHQTYVNSLNEAEEKYAAAVHANDVQAQINLQPLLKFHGGGHINHTLFWENLAPKSAGGGEPPSGELSKAIEKNWGDLANFKKTFNGYLAGIQGSGWSWLVKNKELGELEIISLPNQDPVVGKYVPIMGIDAWEHAYYLQYENRKAEYFGAVWDVINWKTAVERYSKA